MTPNQYLRRPLHRESAPSRWKRTMLAAVVVLLVFGIVDTFGSVQVTTLTRDIARSKKRLTECESELSYFLERHEHELGREVVLDRMGRRDGFVTPDSGCVVLVSLISDQDTSR